jgi:hypothetical protein
MWDTSNLSANRRVYLDDECGFETIAQSIVSEATILRSWLEPYRTANPRDQVERSARQVCFRVSVSLRTFDLFYNSVGGLRGRYWQKPELGFEATKQLIHFLKPSLTAFAEANPPRFETRSRYATEMSLADVGLSLDAPSAKVWVGEEALVMGQPELVVKRWVENEGKEIAGLRSKGARWRCAPESGEIEVKGALIDSSGGEHVPISKERRSEEIHYFGFT